MALDDYLALIPPPNNIQPKFMDWMAVNLKPYVDTMAALASMDDAFNIDDAVGDQLDIIGDILRVPRRTNYQPDGGFSAIMDDDTYRIALKARIVLNQWKGTKDEIYDFWQQFLPDVPVLIQDNQDMSMSVLVMGMPNDLTGSVSFGLDMETDSIKGLDEGYWSGFGAPLRQLVTHGYFTPKPAGVSVGYSFMDTAVFALDIESTFLKGLDEGSWPTF